MAGCFHLEWLVTSKAHVTHTAFHYSIIFYHFPEVLYPVIDNDVAATFCEQCREPINGFHTHPLGLQCQQLLRKLLCVTNLTWMLVQLDMWIMARRHWLLLLLKVSDYKLCVSVWLIISLLFIIIPPQMPVGELSIVKSISVRLPAPYLINFIS